MFNALELTKDKTHLSGVSAVIKNDCSPSELSHAVHNQQLKLQYQPRYDSQTGQFIMLEADSLATPRTWFTAT